MNDQVEVENLAFQTRLGGFGLWLIHSNSVEMPVLRGAMPDDVVLWFRPDSDGGALWRACIYPGIVMPITIERFTVAIIMHVPYDAMQHDKLLAILDRLGSTMWLCFTMFRIVYTPAQARALLFSAAPLPFPHARVVVERPPRSQKFIVKVELDAFTELESVRTIDTHMDLTNDPYVDTLIEQYKQAQQPRASLFISYRTNAYNPWANVGVAKDWVLVHVPERSIRFDGPVSGLTKQGRLVFEHLATNPVDCTITLEQDYVFPRQPVHTADWFKLPFNTERIVAFMLATDGALPAYVVLWIFDWLPWARHFTELRKITIIERVRDSIRRVGARRAARNVLVQ